VAHELHCDAGHELQQHAAHFIAPHLTPRQWVLTVPFELRLLLAAKPEALSAMGRTFVQEIQRWQRQQARAPDCERADRSHVVTAAPEETSGLPS